MSRETGGSAVTVLLCAISDVLASDETVAIAATRTSAVKAGETSPHGRSRVTA